MLAPVSTSDTWTDTITQNKRGAFHLERGALKYQGVKTSESQPVTCAASLSCSAPLRWLLSTRAEMGLALAEALLSVGHNVYLIVHIKAKEQSD